MDQGMDIMDIREETQENKMSEPDFMGNHEDGSTRAPGEYGSSIRIGLLSDRGKAGVEVCAT